MISISGANHLLGLFGNLEAPVPVYYVALSQSEITPTMTGDDLVEPVGIGNYQRFAIVSDSDNWELNGTALWNRNDLVFPAATAEWGIVRSWALCTSPVSGDVFVFDDLVEPFAIEVDDQITIPAGSIYIDIGVDTWSM